MPTREEIKAAAYVLCRQNNENPDVADGSGDIVRSRWMAYRRKAEKILEAAEEARKKGPRRCSHPIEFRYIYEGDVHWTCEECYAEFETRESKTPLSKEELAAVIRAGKQQTDAA